MKVAQLLETDDLEEVTQLMQLRATSSKLSQAQAEAALKWLNEKGYHAKWSNGDGTAKNPGPGRPYLRIIGASWNNRGWRSGVGAVERGAAMRALREFGYKASGSEQDVKNDKDDYSVPMRQRNGNLPHVYFW